jgi:hypothetical protein
MVLGEAGSAVVCATLVRDAQAMLPEPDDKPRPKPEDEYPERAPQAAALREAERATEEEGHRGAQARQATHCAAPCRITSDR